MLARAVPTPAPPAIVERGRIHLGWFSTPFSSPNIEAAASSWIGRLVPAPLRRLRLKQWHYTSVVDERVFLACAVVDAGYLSTAFAYVVDRATGESFEYSTLGPPGAATVASNSMTGTTSLCRPGWGSIALGNDTAVDKSGKRTIDVQLEGRLRGEGGGAAPPVRAHFEVEDRLVEPTPVVIVEETAPGHLLYTHKAYGLAARGTLETGALRHEMGDGHAGLDYNRGFRPYETWWNWAAGGGYCRDGRRVGFNLTAHRRWDGRGAGTEDGDAGDCAVWLGGRVIKVERVEFEYDPEDLRRPWRVVGGPVDLTFEPAGERHEDIDFAVVVSRFHQPFGHFSGTIADPESGLTATIDEVFGVTEQHFARW